jgi:hypothetical protein
MLCESLWERTTPATSLLQLSKSNRVLTNLQTRALLSSRKLEQRQNGYYPDSPRNANRPPVENPRNVLKSAGRPPQQGLQKKTSPRNKSHLPPIITHYPPPGPAHCPAPAPCAQPRPWPWPWPWPWTEPTTAMRWPQSPEGLPPLPSRVAYSAAPGCPQTAAG